MLFFYTNDSFAFTEKKVYIESQSVKYDIINITTISLGGNVNSSSMSTCNNDISRGNFMEKYIMLTNCSAMIDEKCNLTPAKESMMVGMEKCDKRMKAFKNITKGNAKIRLAIKIFNFLLFRLYKPHNKWNTSMCLLD